MKKHTPYTPLASLLLLAYTAVAALAQTPLQLRWQAAANDPQPWRGLVFRGESVGLNPSLTLYGRALALPPEATATLYWQTPGMEGAWWTAPATCSTNGQLSATWTPAMDNGSPLYTFYIGVQHPDDTRTYRAYGQLRMQNAPGAVPNEIDLPPRTLDFATVLVTNAPWATPDDLNDFITTEHDPVATPIAQQALDKANAATSGLQQKANKETIAGGFVGGFSSSAYSGAAVGGHAEAVDGGAVGSQASTSWGGAVGSQAVSTFGGAVGSEAVSTFGGAIGYKSSSGLGGAVGAYTSATDGFSGGKNATSPVNAIQLGEGENTEEYSLQIYGNKLMSGDGTIPIARTPSLSLKADQSALNTMSNTLASAINLKADQSALALKLDKAFADIATNVVYNIVVSNGHWIINEVQ